MEMRKKSHKFLFIWLIMSLLLTLVLNGSFTQLKFISASELEQQKVTIDFKTDQEFQKINGITYSKFSNLNAIVSIEAPPGKKIAKVIQQQESGEWVDISTTNIKGKNSTKEEVALIGNKKVVSSKYNDSAKGYFAWYRKPVSQKDIKGVWYAEVVDKYKQIQTVSCESKEKEKILNMMISKYPGCLSSSIPSVSSLSLQVKRSKPFRLEQDSIEISEQLISNQTVQEIIVDTQSMISGPAGIQPGFTRSDKIKNIQASLTQKNQNNEYKIEYHYDFNYLSEYAKDQSNPPNGSKMMVYYSSFLFNISGYTYSYPNEVIVEFVDINSTINQLPIAKMIVPNGTFTNPSMIESTTPLIEWTQTDRDSNTMFTYFQILIYSQNKEKLIFDSGQQGQSSSSSQGKWRITQSLPTDQIMQITVRVFDGTDWSSYAQPTWFIAGSSPNASIDWFPKPVWEGDNISIFSPEMNDYKYQISYQWKITSPNQERIGFKTKQVSSKFSQKGNYRIVLEYFSQYFSKQTSTDIQVKSLEISCEISHLTQWKLFHEKKKHQTLKNPKDFYSGERMNVGCQLSPAPIKEVKVWLRTTGIHGKVLFESQSLAKSKQDASKYTAEFFSPQFLSLTEGIPQGKHELEFQVIYSNEVVKQTKIPFNILGNIRKATEVHRLQ